MADAQYDVQADIRLGTSQASRNAIQLGNQISNVGQRIRGTNNAGTAMLRNMVAVGATYIGFRALSRVFGGLTRNALAFTSELEKTQIGLGSVLAAVEGTTFEEGMKRGSKVFKELTNDAIKSTATTLEMFRIYQGIIGPIRAAGHELADVREITNSTVAAASALNVDFAQAQRDIQLMVQGTAGMDTRLFAILRSTGAIAESTEEWNKGLTATERIEKLKTALAKFTPAADAYAKSWAGITSSFQDITEQLLAVATGPVFEALKNFIGGINDRLMANRDALEAFLIGVGETMGKRLEAMFMKVSQGINFIILNWDKITLRAEKLVARMKELAPVLAKAAAAYAAISIGRSVVGAGISGVGAAVSLGGMLAGAGGGAAAAGAGGAQLMLPGFAAGGAGGGALATFTAALGPLAAAIALVGGAVLVVMEQWESFRVIFVENFGALGVELLALGKVVLGILIPAIKMFMSGFLMPMTGMFSVMIPIAKALVIALRFILSPLALIANYTYETVKPAFDAIYSYFAGLAKWLNLVTRVKVPDADGIGEAERTRLQKERSSAEREVERRAAERRALAAGGFATRRGPWAETVETLGRLASGGGFGGRRDGGKGGAVSGPGAVPPGRPTTVNDFRGSKITVKQEFREADPDRIMVQMIDDLNKQAEMRIRTGFAPALSG